MLYLTHEIQLYLLLGYLEQATRLEVLQKRGWDSLAAKRQELSFMLCFLLWGIHPN